MTLLVQCPPIYRSGITSPHSLSFSSTPTVGNTVIVFLMVYYGSPTTSGSVTVSDNQGNTYIRRSYYDAFYNECDVEIHSAIVLTANGTFTVTVTPSSNCFCSLVIAEFSDVGTFDQQNATKSSDGTSITSGNVTPTKNNELLVGCGVCWGSTTTVTENENWTLLAENENGVEYPILSAIYQIQTIATTTNASWTLGNIKNAPTGLIATFGSSTIGSTAWGHTTSAQEGNLRTFSGNWTGTGMILGTGDTEKILLSTGNYIESEVVDSGINPVTLTKNKYGGSDTSVLFYRTGSSVIACQEASWQAYSGSFASTGYTQIRVEHS